MRETDTVGNETNQSSTSLKLAKLQKKLNRKLSFEKQLEEWNDPELLMKNEKEFMKDPYRTIFISRLDYNLSEIEISNNLSKYGIIESIKIIRDKSGKSRGYGFVVYERLSDAETCINELASTGLKIPDVNRTILVDIERGRLVRTWKPRRLGGGLGGRNYTKPSQFLHVNSSAAASGRRLNIQNNPYNNNSSPQPSSMHGSVTSSSSINPLKRSAPSRPANADNKRPYIPAVSTIPTASTNSNESIRDKYAKYNVSDKELSSSGGYKGVSSGRSIRSIRQRD